MPQDSDYKKLLKSSFIDWVKEYNPLNFEFFITVTPKALTDAKNEQTYYNRIRSFVALLESRLLGKKWKKKNTILLFSFAEYIKNTYFIKHFHIITLYNSGRPNITKSQVEEAVKYACGKMKIYASSTDVQYVKDSVCGRCKRGILNYCTKDFLKNPEIDTDTFDSLAHLFDNVYFPPAEEYIATKEVLIKDIKTLQKSIRKKSKPYLHPKSPHKLRKKIIKVRKYKKGRIKTLKKTVRLL